MTLEANPAVGELPAGVQHAEPVSIADIWAARRHIADGALRTPLVRLKVDDAPAEIYLKLENLQPTGSFKLRGAANAMKVAGRERLRQGVWTASTGNMAQGVAWYARHLGVPCRVIVPDTASELKLAAIRRLGGEVIIKTWEEYFDAQKTWQAEGMEGLFVHPFAAPAVMAGNGTIALEILEDLPAVETIIVSYGGGGLAGGIGSALRALKPSVRLLACETATGGPLGPSLAAGERLSVPHVPSFVDAIGCPMVFPQMWRLAQALVQDSIVLPLEQIGAAVALLAERNHVVAEGAGAIPVAAALSGRAGGGKIVCVISGGNISNARLATLLRGDIPA